MCDLTMAALAPTTRFYSAARCALGTAALDRLRDLASAVSTSCRPAAGGICCLCARIATLPRQNGRPGFPQGARCSVFAINVDLGALNPEIGEVTVDLRVDAFDTRCKVGG